MSLRVSRRPFFLLATTAVVALFSRRAAALAPDKGGFFHTGGGVRVKHVAFITVKAYAIDHFMRALPPSKSKQAVIDIDVDKRLGLRMLRDVPEGKIKTMFRDAFALNGYRDRAKIEAFVGVFTAELKEGARTTIAYDAAKKATTVSTQRGGTATIAGVEFMRAVWRVWFGKSEQPELGDALIAKL
jgi:hypothetical protein